MNMSDIHTMKLGIRTTETVYRALASMGSGWHTRAELCAAMGKQKLTTSEVAAINMLLNSGRIEARHEHATHSELVQKWVYRIVESGENEKSEGTA